MRLKLELANASIGGVHGVAIAITSRWETYGLAADWVLMAIDPVMVEVNQFDAKQTESSGRWAIGLTLLMLSLQIGVALLLNALLQGKEIANDVAEYRFYVEQPWVLLNPPPGIKMYGGWIAAPLLPLLLATIYQPLQWLGAGEFLAFRGTMIFWLTLGFGITIQEIFRRWGTPRTKRQVMLALALTCSPLTWFPSAVLTQDECLAGFWCALCFVCWSRWGLWGCWLAAATGVFAAKPFFLVYFAALWMAYPAQRKSLFWVSILPALGLFGFMYWRDGQLHYVHFSVQSYMSGSLYSLAWLWDGTVTNAAGSAHRAWAKQFSTLPTVFAMGAYGLLAWRVRFTLPSAVVGLYCVMFTFLVGMMPEYELWYWSWSLLLIWVACRNGEWLLGSLLYLHSVLGYGYKLLYACDSKNFYLTELKPTAIWYDRHIGWNLWWVMVLLSIALVSNTLCLALLLWRKYPRLAAEPIPEPA